MSDAASVWIVLLFWRNAFHASRYTVDVRTEWYCCNILALIVAFAFADKDIDLIQGDRMCCSWFCNDSTSIRFVGIHFTNIFAVFKADIAEAEGIAKALSATSALIATQITIIRGNSFWKSCIKNYITALKLHLPGGVWGVTSTAVLDEELRRLGRGLCSASSCCSLWPLLQFPRDGARQNEFTTRRAWVLVVNSTVLGFSCTRIALKGLGIFFGLGKNRQRELWKRSVPTRWRIYLYSM